LAKIPEQSHCPAAAISSPGLILLVAFPLYVMPPI